MIRIAKAGVIITPSMFSEFLFGRAYHRWLITEHNNTIFFFKKRAFEDRPFGEHPKWDEERKSWKVTEDTNPFDILLNASNWYHGRERFPRLSNILRKYWKAHSPLIEVVFLWEDSFQYLIYD
jgi:hypothetical protein